MTEKTQPTDAEILDAADDFRSQYNHGGTTFDEFDALSFARAVLAKWGTPAPVGVEPVALLVRKNSWRDGQWEAAPPNSPSYGLGWANQRVYVFTTPQPTQAQAGAVPLTPDEALDAFCHTPGIHQFVQAFIAGVRFAEQHHGIKGGQHGADR